VTELDVVEDVRELDEVEDVMKLDEVEDVVELASLNANGERDVDVHLWATVVLLLVPLCWHALIQHTACTHC